MQKIPIMAEWKKIKERERERERIPW
jgi:hypothetical protein